MEMTSQKDGVFDARYRTLTSGSSLR